MTTTRPQASKAATATLDALYEADHLYGADGVLTEEERSLIRGISYRLRHRIGERRNPSVSSLHTLGTELILLYSEDIRREAQQ